LPWLRRHLVSGAARITHVAVTSLFPARQPYLPNYKTLSCQNEKQTYGNCTSAIMGIIVKQKDTDTNMALLCQNNVDPNCIILSAHPPSPEILLLSSRVWVPQVNNQTIESTMCLCVCVCVCVCVRARQGAYMQFQVCRSTTNSKYKQAHQLGNTSYNKTRQTTYGKNACLLSRNDKENKYRTLRAFRPQFSVHKPYSAL
jgi:hypothetical protein